jgi:energy-converting hydrogenase Eha subunit G
MFSIKKAHGNCGNLFILDVVTILHVVVLAQVGGDLANLGEELDVQVLLLPPEDGILKVGKLN